MSYSQQLKNELCQIEAHCPGCQRAMLYGFLLFSRGVSRDKVTFHTENKKTADLIAHILVAITGAIVTLLYPDFKRNSKRPYYTVSLEDSGDINRVMREFFPLFPADREYISPEYFQQECCEWAFLRGAYLICGSMLNPEREYHLEFNLMNQSLCSDLIAFLEQYDLTLHESRRKKDYIAYLKESTSIEDLLVHLGAMKSSFSLMNLKIEKELRNNVNRVINCETANIGKTVNAALFQLEAINLLEQRIGLHSLPPALQEAANLRKAYPEYSLRELSEISNGAISRSGLNHRLKKLCELAENLISESSKEVKKD